ncbi:MAG: HemK2/MTQ2 family protein methyltransferase [Candidatus Micrarchaeia archaeon]
MLEVEGVKIENSALVYEPAEDTFLAMNAIKKAAEGLKAPASIIDIGTGTGILGIYAASITHAKRLVLCDINKHAIELAQRNYELNGLNCKDVEIKESDLFENIDGVFDLLIFNAPYLRSTYSSPSMLNKAWEGGRRGIEISIKFLNQAAAHSDANSRIILIASSLSDFDGLKKSIEELGYEVKDLAKEHYFFEDIIALTLAKA